MLKKILFSVVTGFLVLSFATNLLAASSALPFLRIAPSARAAGMGETFVAVAEGVDSTYWNPAGLANMDSMDVSLTHMLYWDSSSYDYVGFSYPFSKQIKLGAHLIYMSYGAIEKISESTSGSIGTTSGTFTPSDLAFAVSAGYLLNRNIQLGATIKYAMQTIDTSSVSAFALDVGALVGLKMLDENLIFGAAVSNFGTQISGDSLPLTARGGVSDKFKLLEPEDLTVAVTAYYPFDTGKLSENIGAEFWYQKEFAVRLGYKLGYDVGGLSVGLGYRSSLEGMFGYEIDYTYASSGNLGDTHRVSVVLFLDEGSSRGGKGSRGGGGAGGSSGGNKGVRTSPGLKKY